MANGLNLRLVEVTKDGVTSYEPSYCPPSVDKVSYDKALQTSKLSTQIACGLTPEFVDCHMHPDTGNGAEYVSDTVIETLSKQKKKHEKELETRSTTD